MALAVERSALLTADDLFRLPDDFHLYELDEGQLIVMAPAGGAHGSLESVVHFHLYDWVRRRKLGKVYPGDTGFVLSRDPDTVRAPDVAFVRAERLPLPTHAEDGFLVGAPDLAVEIRSPHQSPADLRRKVEQYLAAGTRTVWVIRPRRRMAEIVEQGAAPREIGPDGDLEAPVLPGLRLKLGDLFDEAG